MYISTSVLFIVLAVLVIVLITIIIFQRQKSNKVIKTNDASLTCEELEIHARKVAVEHSIGKKNSVKWPVPRMMDNYDFIHSVYKSLNDDIQKKRAIPPASEWLLDNFYIIEEQVKSINRDLLKKEYSMLPVLKCGTLKGYPRIHAVAMDLVAHTDGQIDENIIYNYLKAYQSHTILLDREIWVLPTMIRLSLIENIRSICEKIRETQSQWAQADEIIDNWLNNEGTDADRILRMIKNKFKNSGEIYPSFIEHLSYRLRREKRGYTQVLKYIDESLGVFGISVGETALKEHNSQAVYTVSIGNCIVSLKYISTFDWSEIFESISIVEQTLRQDPDGTYPLMDFSSRNFYRRQIEKMARKYKISELHIVREAVELAKAGKASSSKEEVGYRSHAGYYIIGKGSQILKNRLKVRDNIFNSFSQRVLKHPGFLYIGLMIILLAALEILLCNYVFYSFSERSLIYTLMSGVFMLIPLSEVVIGLVNWLVCSIHKPYTFPRLELKEGIPSELTTVIAMPVLLSDSKRVEELLENLESHYLSNKYDNVFFAIVGDLKDSDIPIMSADKEIISSALEGVKKLNKKYSKRDNNIFYFLYRHRTFNESHKKWMGWERKRGALLEFNNLLLGSRKTSFANTDGISLGDAGIKYVITLDADTILPIGMAKKMIGTIAHPLNRAVIDVDKGVVIEGYGLIQPKVSFDIESSNKSLFSRIFTGQEGIDPYSSAISDIYQDIFCEGIYTGKGIYDLYVYQTVLENAIPDDAILSHDLLEGCYIRAGLASDLELIDSYPSKYNSYAARLHRWVRGDWQLIGWLRKKVPNRTGLKVQNPLSLISKWKILDNMRRSLVSPASMLLIILGFSLLPGSSLFYLVIALLPLLVPLITGIIAIIISGRIFTKRIKRYMPVISGFKATFLQTLLTILFLPHQAYLMLNAVAVTIGRVLFTRRNMLEWVTAADVEKGQKNSLDSYMRKMGAAIFEGLIIVLLALLIKPAWLYIGLLLLVIWACSPLIAYRISIIDDYKPARLSDSNILELRRYARKTYRYFEEFADMKNHYLAPDNFQEDPPRGIAYRSSPTNIGLGLLANITARDLGFIGTREMIDNLSNTISTIEKMDKWNGHLYNWYDTRTLRPLKPRYVSTVDSGNFVCYLITLEQGLKEYLNTPLFDNKLIKGMRDTFSLAGSDELELFDSSKALSKLILAEHAGISNWNAFIEELLSGFKLRNNKKSPWKSKAFHATKALKKDINEFFSWLECMSDVPQGFPQAALGDIKNALASIELNSRLSDLNPDYEKACGLVDTLCKDFNNNDEEDGNLKWLLLLQDKLDESSRHIKLFVDRYNNLIERITALSEGIRFSPLYVEKKQMFSIGYNIEEERLTNSFYDLLASEARQTSFIAIARGEVPLKHWFKLGRALTTVDNYKGLVSWTGTMFEYLMPLIIMKSYKNTLLDETYSFVIRSQHKYGKQRGIPWGASESCFYSLDINLDYQYKAIGVPWLGLKRGLVEDAVSAPYATLLAFLVDPETAMENLNKLRREGLEGPYGFYEAVDYTQGRIPFGAKRAIIKSFMAHHQGMGLLSLNNYINDSIMQVRFHADPVVKSAKLLLQEKVPVNIVYTKETKEKVIPFKDIVYKERGPLRKFRLPDPVLQKVHILSNGYYTVMLTDRGTGFSRTKTASVTRWREDSTLDSYGMFFYIRNTTNNRVWSSAYAPFNFIPDKYEVTFLGDKVRFRRFDGEIETETEIVVTSGDNAEIRRISLKNHGQIPCILEVTSYFETIIAPQASDVAHPAFSNLFVKTEFIPESGSIIATRRPRTETEKNMWIAHTAVSEGKVTADTQFETDRVQFLGRGHTTAMPAVIEQNKPLSNSSGPILDPIMSLRKRIEVGAGETAKISFITIVCETSEALMDTIERYNSPEAVEGAFRLALTRSQVEARYLNIKASEMEFYQEMLSHILFISPLRRQYQEIIIQNKKGQPSLWPYGISGDLPIVLVILKKSDEVDTLYEVLKMHEYWRIKELKVDLVILNNEENSYTHPLGMLLSDIITASHAHEMLNKPGGVYVLNWNNIPEEDINLLYAVARLVLRGDGGLLPDQVKRVQANQLPRFRHFIDEKRNYPHSQLIQPELKFFNGIGGFRPDGNEYVIFLGKGQNTPMPWINVIANKNFGFIATEAGSGYTWCENSRENKLTPWTNDPVSDTPAEIIYTADTDTADIWSVSALPVRDEEPYLIRHGFGYSIYEHESHGVFESLVQFVPIDDTVKISILKVKNTSEYQRNLSFTYYIRPVAGVNEQSSAIHIRTASCENGALIFENPYNEEFGGRIGIIDVSEKEKTVTCDRKEFFGMGKLSSPDALKRSRLSGTTGSGYDPCCAMQANLHLGLGEEKEIVFVLAMYPDSYDFCSKVDMYKDINYSRNALEQVKAFWQDKLGTIRVSTPDQITDIILNGWLMYQTLSCRIWARSAFYQSGGALGFRDQLQDCLAVLKVWPEITRNQIILHAGHQFTEGDVQHWWHEPSGKGTRTKFSDDLLWLPYTVAEYIEATEDYELLEVMSVFREDEPLKEFEDERYSIPAVSAMSSSIYDHCIRAIDRSLRFGEHGLPLMGSGDWNDGMNNVGSHGNGESVWLGWFLYSVLQKFSDICLRMNDSGRAEDYRITSVKIKTAIEESAWDGNWYKRAFFDNGTPLGSVQNSECKIDSIAQSWAVISGAGNEQRANQAMNSLENYLVMREEGIIKLLTPPFDEGDLQPGYIKGYVPGVRENGGQYTHAAVWTVIALTLMGEGDRAWEYFNMLNPINHSLTFMEYSKYKVEPYVIAADVYAVHPHTGRGGWTWYTGAAGWMYRAGVEFILGLKKLGNTLVLDPCIPARWTGYKINYKHNNTLYEIDVVNPHGVCKGVVKVSCDGIEKYENTIILSDDGAQHKVIATMGKSAEA